MSEFLPVIHNLLLQAGHGMKCCPPWISTFQPKDLLVLVLVVVLVLVIVLGQGVFFGRWVGLGKALLGLFAMSLSITRLSESFCKATPGSERAF